MKRNTKLVDNDSDNEIWQYKSDRHLKHSKLRRPGKERKTKASKEEIEAERCPLCQVPLCLLAKGSQHQHVSECVNMHAAFLPECPDGAICDSRDLQHYSVFRHSLLANILDGFPSSTDAEKLQEQKSSNDAEQLKSKEQKPLNNAKELSSSSIQQSAECTNSAECLTVSTAPATEYRKFEVDMGNARENGSVDVRTAEMLFPSDAELIESSSSDIPATCVDVPGTASSSVSPHSTHVSSTVEETGNTSASCFVTVTACDSDKNIRRRVSQDFSGQSSIRSFFKPVSMSKAEQNDNSLPSSLVKNVGKPALSHSCDANTKVQNSSDGNVASFHSLKTNVNSTVTTESSSFTSKTKKCPFYKWISGTSFTVDAFSYGSIPGCTAYFLSHFHYDHYVGLNKSFQHKVYCSQVTANLVRLRLKVSPQLICPLPLEVTQLIDDIEVTLLSANHCPGSVLFLFKKKSCTDDAQFEYSLHTGDFRAEKEMLAYPQLQSLSISQLYLDTTYCDPSYAFPSQQDVITFAVQTSVAFLQAYPDALIAVGSYTIGKERLFHAIAETLDCKICVTKEKKSILECMENVSLSQRLTLLKHEARVHVLAMNQINATALTTYLDSLRPRFNHILAFEPTGWTHSNKLLSVDHIRPRCSTAHVTIYGVPYSEHSSYDELKAFVQFIRPTRIFPTVNNGSALSRKKMFDLFNAWLSAPVNAQQALHQTALKSWLQ